MSDFSRYRRTDPSRVGPNRFFSNVYRPVHKMGPGGQAMPFTPPGAASGSAPRSSGPGVDSAYRVMNKFIPRNQWAGNQYHQQSGNQYHQHSSYSPRFGHGMVGGMQQLMDGAISTYGGMARAMMDMLNCMYGGYGGYGSDYCEEWNVQGGYGFEPLATYLCTEIRLNMTGNRLVELALEFWYPTNLTTLDTGDLLLVSADGKTTLTGKAKFADPQSTDNDKRKILTVAIDQDPNIPNGVYQAGVFFLDSSKNKQCCGVLMVCLY